MIRPILEGLVDLADGSFPHVFDASLKASLLIVAAALVVRSLRTRAAADRHLIWGVVLMAALAMPVLSKLVPVSLSVPIDLSFVSSVAESTRSPAPMLEATKAAVATSGQLNHTGGSAEASEATTGSEVVVVGNEETEASPAPASTSIEPSSSSRSEVRPGRLVPAAHGSERDALPARSVLAAIWAGGVVVLLAGLVVGWLRLTWMSRTATDVTQGPLRHAADTVAARLGLRRRPRLLQGDDTVVPMTWGIVRPIVLLPAGAESWEPSRLEAVLIHELGHARRGDYPLQLAARLACALHWFNPMFWVVEGKMRIEREYACDDLVVASGHDAPEYANDLIGLARSLRAVGTPAVAMARPGHLRARLVALMDESRTRSALTRRASTAVSVAVFTVGLFLAGLSPTRAAVPPNNDLLVDAAPVSPDLAVGEVDDVPGASGAAAAAPTAASRGRASSVAVAETPPSLPETSLVTPIWSRGVSNGFGAPKQGPVAPLLETVPPQEAAVLCGPADGEARRVASLTDDGVRSIEAEFGDCRSRIRIEGEITFSEDFTRVTRVSSGGLLRIELDRDGMRRRVEVRPGGGEPQFRWWVGGEERAFDDAAEQWLSLALTDMFRSSGYKARERATWIFGQQGVQGLLDEVERMYADHAQATYLGTLVEIADLSPAEGTRVVQLAGREIESDHSLSRFLESVATHQQFDATTRAAFLEAAGTIESDHTQGRVFSQALRRDDLSQRDLTVLLEAAGSDIESDHTLGELLIELADRYPMEEGLRAPFLAAAATLESDHTAGRVYSAVLAQPGLSSRDLATILESTASISSDHELSSLLIQLADHGLGDPSAQRAFLAAAGSVQSDHSLGQTLDAFIGLGDPIGETQLIELLQVARSIESDHTLAQVLIAFADHHPVEGAVRDAFLATLDQIESEHQHGRVSSALVRR